MNSKKIFHVFAEDRAWKVEREGELAPLSIQATKREAISAAKEIAKKELLSEVKVHSQNGSIEIEYTYGKKPLFFKVKIQSASFEYSPEGSRLI